MIQQRHRADQVADLDEARPDHDDVFAAFRPSAGKLAGTARLLRDAAGEPRPGDLRAALRAAAQSSGVPLPPGLLDQLERALRADLSRVRLHTGPEAARAAEAVGARAFAFGQDVYFAAGQFDPASEAGRRLIAHEVAHTVQQPSGGKLEDASISAPGEAAETEAHAFADAFAARWGVAREPARGDAAKPAAPVRPAAPGVIHRDAAPTSAPAAASAGANAESGEKDPDKLTPEQQREMDQALANADKTAADNQQKGAEGEAKASESQAKAGEKGAAAQQGQQQAQGKQNQPQGGGGGGAAPAPSVSGGGGGGGGGAVAGGGGAPAPAAAPALAPQPTDGLVDYYMETHWDQSAFRAAMDQHGAPANLPKALSEIDLWIPAGTSPEVRGTINLACNIGLGIVDGLFWSAFKSIPVYGIFGSVLDGMRNALEQTGKYLEVEDYLGLGLSLFRVFVDTAGSIADNVATCASFVSTACTVAGVACAAIAAILALTGVGAPIAAGLLAAVPELAAIAAAAKEVEIIARAISLVCTQLKVILDLVLMINNALGARDAEARGDFAKAAKYKDLMLGNAVDFMTDSFTMVMDGIGLVMLVMTPASGMGSLAKDVGKQVIAQGGRAFAQTGMQAFRAVGSVAARGVLGAPGSTFRQVRNAMRFPGRVTTAITGPTGGASGKDALGPGVGGANSPGGGAGFQDLIDVEIPGLGISAADEMRTSTTYIDPARAQEVEGQLGAAQDQTIEQLAGADEAVASEPPLWYQGLINEVLGQKSTADRFIQASDMMKPSYWIRQALGGLRGLLGMLPEDDLEGIASGVETAAGWLTSRLQPVVGWVNQFIATAKPKMQEILEQANERIQSSQVNLTRMQNMVAQVRQGTDAVNNLTRENGVIDQKYLQIRRKLESWRITRASLGIPARTPWPFSYVDGRINSVINAINAPVNGAIRAAEVIKNQIVARVQAWITTATTRLAFRLADIQAMISEGGVVHQNLTSQHRAFQSLFAQATRAFAQWDGQIHLDLGGAGQWLRSVAASARRANAIQSGQQADPWTTTVLPQAQQYVTDWKGRHTPHVEALYMPRVPQHEIAACVAVYTQARPAARGAVAAELDAAYQECLSYAGRTGREALYGLWAAEGRLSRAAQAAHTGQIPDGRTHGADQVAQGAADDAAVASASGAASGGAAAGATPDVGGGAATGAGAGTGGAAPTAGAGGGGGGGSGARAGGGRAPGQRAPGANVPAGAAGASEGAATSGGAAAGGGAGGGAAAGGGSDGAAAGGGAAPSGAADTSGGAAAGGGAAADTSGGAAAGGGGAAGGGAAAPETAGAAP